MLNIITSKTERILKDIAAFAINKKNLQTISNLYRETYDRILTDNQLENYLIQGILELDNFNGYKFFNIKTGNEISIFDILIEKKSYTNKDSAISGNVLNYKDLMNLNFTLRKVKILDDKAEEIRGMGKQRVAFELSKLSQANLFMHLFRSLFVDEYGDIQGIFNLRFFNQEEILRLAEKDNVNLWVDVLDGIERSKIANNLFFSEKVDGQLLLVYNLNGKTVLQSKKIIIDINDLLEKRVKDSSVFLDLSDFYRKRLGIDLTFLDQISKQNPDIIYHFEFLRQEKSIIQEYNTKSLGLYFLGARNKHGFFSEIESTTFQDFIFDYNNIYNSMYSPIFSVFKNEISLEELYIHKVEHSDKLEELNYNIKIKRLPDNINIDEYIIEGYIYNFRYVKMKVKSPLYFLEKVFHSFSEKRIKKELKYIESIMYGKERQKLIKIMDEMFDILRENNSKEFDMEFLNNEIRKKFRNNKLAKFLRFLNKYYSIDQNFNLFKFGNVDPKNIIAKYKHYLVYYFFTEISKALLSDSEEIAELHNLLNIKEHLDLDSETIISDLRDFLLDNVEEGNFNENNVFLNRLASLRDYILFNA